MKVSIVIENGYVYAVGNIANNLGEVRERKKLFSIVPKNRILKMCFYILRWIFGDNSQVAQWTRTWKCTWLLVNNGSREIIGEFSDRKEALLKELELVTNYIQK